MVVADGRGGNWLAGLPSPVIHSDRRGHPQGYGLGKEEVSSGSGVSLRAHVERQLRRDPFIVVSKSRRLLCIKF